MKKILSLCLLLSTANSVFSKKPKLVSISSINSSICFDIKRNVTECYVRPEVAHALDSVQKKLAAMGLGLKVFEAYCTSFDESFIQTRDGYIPAPDECYRHCLGTCVDVTIVDMHGNELDMGTGFDEFCPEAYPTCLDFDKKVLDNRALLNKMMSGHGFVQSEVAWWHFDIENWQDFQETENE